MSDADGAPRGHWTRLLALLGDLAPDEIEHRFAAADRHIRDTGVSYRVYGEAQRAQPGR